MGAVVVQDVGGHQLQHADKQRGQLAFLANSMAMSKALLYRRRKASPAGHSSAEATAEMSGETPGHDLPHPALGGVSQTCSAQKGKAARRY